MTDQSRRGIGSLYARTQPLTLRFPPCSQGVGRWAASVQSSQNIAEHTEGSSSEGGAKRAAPGRQAPARGAKRQAARLGEGGSAELAAALSQLPTLFNVLSNSGDDDAPLTTLFSASLGGADEVDTAATAKGKVARQPG